MITGSTSDGVNVHQWSLTQATNQQFLFEHTGSGAYKVTAVNSGKALDVNSSGKDNGINVQQWSYFGYSNQQFIAVSTGDGFFKLVARHSGKLLEVAGFSTANGGPVQQWENLNQSSGMWKLIRPTVVAGGGGSNLEQPATLIYPNPGRSGQSNEVVITVGKPSEHVWLTLMNDQGHLIMSGEHKVVDSKVSVSIPTVSAGLYLIRLQDQTHTWTEKYLVK